MAAGLAQAESTFASRSVEVGMKEAFLEAMDNKATLFRPGPTLAKPYIAGRPDPPIRLEWRPQFVVVASSGELGLSTGPWKSTAKDGSGTPSYGQFLTVWKNGQDRWSFLIDHGVSNDGPIGWSQPLDATVADGSRPIEPVTDAEARFNSMSANLGIGRAYKDFGSNALRALRNDGPLIFDPAIVTHTSPLVLLDESLWTFTVTDSGTSNSGDLGWVMGRYRTTDAKGGRATGYYVRVWRSQARHWRVLADVLAPIEPAAR
jgi:ketosteroid isomerase-like protein